MRAAHDECAAGGVEIGQVESADFAIAETVDGDQRDHQPGHRRGGAVKQAPQPIGRQRGWQGHGGGLGDASGGVTEDEAFLFQCPEDAA